MKRSIVLVLTFLALAMPGCHSEAQPPDPGTQPAPPAETTPTRRALLIGVGNYADDGISDLNGPSNDVAIMASLFGNETFGFTDIVRLVDEEATRAGILAALDALAERSREGDVVAVYYSGHGSVVRDQDGDETDGLDETLVPHDASLDGAGDIRDDELGQRLAAISARTPLLTFISDSCHSGTNTRFSSVATRRFVDRGLEPIAQTDASALSDRLPEIATIAGAQPDEYAYETVFENGETYGALTHALVSVLSSQTLSNYRSLEDQVSARVSARFPRQHPRFEGGGLERAVFGVTVVPTAPYVLAEPKGEREVVLQGGAPSGLLAGTRVEIFPPGTNDFTAARAVAEATVTDVVGARATARLSAPAEIAPHSRARLIAGAFGAEATRVQIEASLPDELAAAVREEVAKLPSLALVDCSANLRVVAKGGFLGIVGEDGSLLTRTVAVDEPDAAARLAGQLHDWARWRSIAAFSNPASRLPVRLHIGRSATVGESPAPDSVAAGENVFLHIENLSPKAVWFVLLDLSSDGSIAVAYPPDGRAEKLPAQSRTPAIPAVFSVPPGRAHVDDTLMVIAATEEFPGWVFEQQAIRSAKSRLGSDCAQPPCVSSDLARLIAEHATALPRAMQTRPLSEWSTARTQVRVLAARPLLEQPRIALHFAEPTEAETLRARVIGRPALCVVPGQPSCAEVEALDASGTVFAVAADRLSARGPVGTDSKSVGQAFSDAYAAGAELGAVYAEPLLTVAVPDEDPDLVGARSSGGGDDPIAKDDDLWNHRYTQVPAAWALRRESGAEAGQEAAGVLIGHPDTGYTLHPESWLDAAARTGPLDLDHDWNYMSGEGDAFDPRTEGFLHNPGHGTAASSVIISPPGCSSELENRDRCVTGVAQGARLVPLRVHESVVVFNSERLVKALNDIAEGRRGDIRMVSLAMGGPPSRALHKAVRALEKKGIPLLAAAGNQVKTVVWPARFDETIAVTAVNPSCALWRGASLGSAVDIAAPGEAVWRATFDKDDFVIEMGKGTTFATGTTAGVAALWLAHHRGPALDALVASGQLTAELRRALAETAWRPDQTIPEGVQCPDTRVWRPRAYGAGIVNARALLERPLSNGAARAAPTPRGTLPLFASLYPEGTASDRIEADYRSLFETPTGAERYETEILYHYTTDEDVRDSLDQLVAATRSSGAAPAAGRALARLDLSRELRAALRRAP
ncbi:caspase family protein [Pseudomarimonas salicorniae]|uniref:Caspase family protein n=1 Tax=Pseudomarimonas salicorniae TaxID=2933270 RepID=A0ABT0GF98_9GAMM|nr:caspase family protein [Lysobacter sp. CAU 1642]MCK7593027.1 caspase family protein [Lysobacter sp. CAU 1642]